MWARSALCAREEKKLNLTYNSSPPPPPHTHTILGRLFVASFSQESHKSSLQSKSKLFIWVKLFNIQSCTAKFRANQICSANLSKSKVSSCRCPYRTKYPTKWLFMDLMTWELWGKTQHPQKFERWHFCSPESCINQSTILPQYVHFEGIIQYNM